MEYKLKEEIRGILNKITWLKPATYWEINCDYADGAGTTLLSLTIKSHNPKKVLGRIVFQQENGIVYRYFYQGLRRRNKGTHVIDVLLEILNVEMSRP